jgi:hypothetical protein
MLRALIVLPVYLGFLYIVPQWALYERFHAAVLATEGSLSVHIAGYAVALVVSAVIALLLEYRWRPRTYALSVAAQVIKVGLIGVVAACGFQLFQFFTSGDLSVFILLLPIIFMSAELVYEFVEYLLSILRPRAKTNITSSEHLD